MSGRGFPEGESGSLGMEDIRDRMRECMVQWFGHVMSVGEEDLVRAIMTQVDPGAGGEDGYNPVRDRSDICIGLEFLSPDNF